jgi:hypothetical protein
MHSFAPLLMEWSQTASETASEFVGLHRVLICAKRPDDVSARGALERTQVGTQERRHDADQQHLSLALRTGGPLNCCERNDGRQRLRFCHNASLEQAPMRCSRSPVTQASMPFRLLARSSILLSFLISSLRPLVVSDQQCLAVTGPPHRATCSKKGPRGFRRRSKSGRKRPGRAATGGLSLILFCKSKRLAH